MANGFQHAPNELPLEFDWALKHFAAVAGVIYAAPVQTPQQVAFYWVQEHATFDRMIKAIPMDESGYVKGAGIEIYSRHLGTPEGYRPLTQGFQRSL